MSGGGHGGVHRHGGRRGAPDDPKELGHTDTELAEDEAKTQGHHQKPRDDGGPRGADDAVAGGQEDHEPHEDRHVNAVHLHLMLGFSDRQEH